jgi:hypothetical protein
MTIFGPNSSDFSADFTGWNGLSNDQLLAILKYSSSEGPPLYSSKFKNNTKIPTLDGISSTMTELNGTFFVDAALIKSTDYLTANGVSLHPTSSNILLQNLTCLQVLQVIDR